MIITGFHLTGYYQPAPTFLYPAATGLLGQAPPDIAVERSWKEPHINPEPEIYGVFLLTLLSIAGLALIWCWLRSSFRFGDERPGVEFEVLPPGDHDRPARQLFEQIAASDAAPAASVGSAFERPVAAAFGRRLSVSRSRIAYRDYCSWQLGAGHTGRLQRFYPGIRVVPIGRES